MKIQKKKLVSIVVTCLLALTMVFTTPMSTSMAKTKTTLSSSEMTIGIGSYGDEYGYYHKTKAKYQILLNDTLKGAKYTFTSSNNKIVTVTSNTKSAYLTGVKKGTATITCKQKLKGKTITIGKCKVTVKNATVNATYKAEESLPIGTDTIGGIDTEQIFYIVNRNPNASYTYTTDSSNLTIKEEVVYPPADFIGAGYFYYSQTYTAKKEGTYTVTVTETYKKKSKKIGSFKVIIHPTEIMEQLTIDLNGSESIRALLNYRKTDMNYYIVGDGFDESTKSDDSIIYIASDEYDTNIYGVKEGTAKLNIYEGKSQSEKVLIGTCTVTVNKTATESISFDEESYSTYVGAPENDDTLYIYLYKEPSNASDEVVVSLSDETIAKLVYDEDEEGYKVLPIKEGKVTLKAQCGDKTATCEVTILGNEDEGDFDEESDFEEE